MRKSISMHFATAPRKKKSSVAAMVNDPVVTAIDAQVIEENGANVLT